MAWVGVPFVDPADWEGFNWQATSFWQQFLDVIEDRFNAILEAAGSTTASLTPLEDGFKIQTVGQINALRSFNGTYLYDSGDVNDDSFDLRAWWVDDAYFVDGADWTSEAVLDDPSHGVLVDPNGLVTQAFVDRVNDILTGWGCDTMGASPISGAIPWTRKWGSNASPSTGNGPVQAGDIIGPWIFNEWRAVLEALDCLFVWPFSAQTNNNTEYRADVATAETSCANAKTAIDAAYAAGTPAGEGEMIGHLESVDFGGGLEFGGYFGRGVPDLDFTARNLAHATGGKIWMRGAAMFGFDFNDFGDGVTEDEIVYLDTFTPDGSAQNYAPPVPTTCGISSVTCPTTDGEQIYEGYDLKYGGATVLFAFPDP